MRQHITQNFRSLNLGGSSLTVADIIPVSATPYTSQRTPGATILDQPTQQGPGQHQHWEIQSVSVLGYLSHFNSNGNSEYGQFGRIRAGLILDQNQSPTSFVDTILAPGIPAPYVRPMLPIAPDLSLVGTMWDPAVDQMPPTTNVVLTPPSALLIETTILPQTTLEITPGVEPSIGIWIEPSLLGSNSGVLGEDMGLAVWWGQYTLNYDDGL